MKSYHDKGLKVNFQVLTPLFNAKHEDSSSLSELVNSLVKKDIEISKKLDS